MKTKTFSNQRRIALLVVVPATLLMAAISSCSSIAAQLAPLRLCEQRELHTAARLIQDGIQSESNMAAARVAVVSHLPSIREPFRTGDRKQILERLLPAFLIQRDRYGVTEGQFHTPPATSFLRIFAPDEGHGEDLSGFRPMVVECNRDHEPKQGIEIGRRGIGIRAIDVVQDARGYIGSFEAGMSFAPVIENLKASTGFEAGAFVDNELMSTVATMLPPPEADEVVAGLRLVDATDAKTVRAVATRELMTSTVNVRTEVQTKGGTEYGITIVPLLDYKGTHIGAILAVQDFDVYSKQEVAAVVRAIAFALLQALVVGGILLVVINVMFIRPAPVEKEEPVLLHRT
jgi:methyl-accepting chemotaxis protein